MLFQRIENDNDYGPRTVQSYLGGEKIHYCKGILQKQFGLFSRFVEETLIITNIAIYNFIKGLNKTSEYKTSYLKRRIKIEDIYGITYSSGSNEFIIHLNKNDYDCLFKSDNRDEIIILLLKQYEKIKHHDILFTVKSDKELSKYIVTQKERRKNPYLFKLDKNDLYSIREFFHLEEE